MIVKICHRTREFKEIKLGFSTRSGLMMVDMLRAKAFLSERDYANDQDLIDLSVDVWTHRIILLNPQIKPKDITEKITREEIKKLLKD